VRASSAKITRATGRNLAVAIAVALGVASPALADQVVPDDQIVQSSICAGFDCVDGESFGFDTLRLKENNLRLHFDDTSSSAGYPANDWRLVANDSQSGGSSYFALEDATAGVFPFRIDSGAPANAMHVASNGEVELGANDNFVLKQNGNLGLGTTDPGLDLSIMSADTPAIRLEQTNGAGFTPQTWDIGANEANFFVRDLTGGSKLSLRIRPGAPTSSIDIRSTGEATAKFGFADFAKLEDLENVAALDPADTLAQALELPISSHNVEGGTLKRIGPTAEDFFAAFGTGANDGYVAPGDLAGVAIAALQGLAAEVDRKVSGLSAEDEDLHEADFHLMEVIGQLRSRIETLEIPIAQQDFGPSISALESGFTTLQASDETLAAEVAELRRQNRALLKRIKKLERAG
jgi:hypothetical protein